MSTRKTKKTNSLPYNGLKHSLRKEGDLRIRIGGTKLISQNILKFSNTEKIVRTITDASCVMLQGIKFKVIHMKLSLNFVYVFILLNSGSTKSWMYRIRIH